MRKFRALATSIAIGLSTVIAVGPALSAPRIEVTQYHQKPGNHGKPGHQKPGFHAHRKAPVKKFAPRHHRPHHAWMKRGGKMPHSYRGKSVDYRRHKLQRPPRGHQWVRYDDTFVLVAISTGIIASVIAATR